MSTEEHQEYAVLADGEPRMDGSHAQVVLGSGFASLEDARRAMAGVSQQRVGLRIAVWRATGWSVVEWAGAAAHWKVILSSRKRRGPSALLCRCRIGVDHDQLGRTRKKGK